jgi:hypothetical protein
MPAEEVADVVKLMFDTELIERPSDAPAPFSSENPPLEVRVCIISDCIIF